MMVGDKLKQIIYKERISSNKKDYDYVTSMVKYTYTIYFRAYNFNNRNETFV